MELRDVLVVLRIRWRMVLVTASLVLGAALAYSLTAPPVYVARSKLFLSVSVGQSSGQLSRGFAYAQNLTVLYSRVAAQPVVLDPVVKELGLDVTAAELSRSVVARTPRDTVIIEIDVSQSDPRRAARIANAVAEQLTTAVGELLSASVGDFPSTTAEGAVPVRVTTVAPAAVPLAPAGPRVGLNTALALTVGLALGGSLALLRDVTSGRIDQEGIGRLAQAPVIATISAGRAPQPAGTRGATAARVLRAWAPRKGTAPREHGDEVLQLRAGFEHLRVKHGLRTVVFTSTFDHAAVAGVVVDLAQALAQAGVRVLIVDADLRSPELDRRCGRAADAGLAAVMRGEVDWSDVVLQLGWDLPDLLPAGASGTGSGPALGGDRLKNLLEQAAARYDVVLVRAPAATRAADGLLLAATIDGTVLVVEQRSSGRDALRECIDNLRLVSAHVIGVVLV